ncbi:olpB [Symbiodinium natans]|uniref:OlpB protein n=1 Tax=Symbiodinium natans TaxID=878477 RepID=A0A812SIT4_9DINO|nr:olpB [Symbiodinium natans]
MLQDQPAAAEPVEDHTAGQPGCGEKAREDVPGPQDASAPEPSSVERPMLQDQPAAAEPVEDHTAGQDQPAAAEHVEDHTAGQPGFDEKPRADVPQDASAPEPSSVERQDQPAAAEPVEDHTAGQPGCGEKAREDVPGPQDASALEQDQPAAAEHVEDHTAGQPGFDQKPRVDVPQDASAPEPSSVERPMLQDQPAAAEPVEDHTAGQPGCGEKAREDVPGPQDASALEQDQPAAAEHVEDHTAGQPGFDEKPRVDVPQDASAPEPSSVERPMLPATLTPTRLQEAVGTPPATDYTRAQGKARRPRAGHSLAALRCALQCLDCTDAWALDSALAQLEAAAALSAALCGPQEADVELTLLEAAKEQVRLITSVPEGLLTDISESGLRRGARSLRARGRLARWRERASGEVEEEQEEGHGQVSAANLELQHLKSMHETLQKEHDGLKQQHQELVAQLAQEEIPEGRLPPAPEDPASLEQPEPTADLPELSPEPPEEPEELQPPAAPAAPTEPAAGDPPPPPRKLLQPTPNSDATPRWGWWRNSRVAPEPRGEGITRHVVRFKDGVQLGPPRLERVWAGAGAAHAGYAAATPPAAPPAPAPATPAYGDLSRTGLPDAWQLHQVWERLSTPAVVPASIPGCAHLRYGTAGEACQDLRLAGGAGAPIVVVAVSSQGLARQAGVLPGFQLMALNGHDLKMGQLALHGEELLPSLARASLGQTRLDFMDPAPQSHGLPSLGEKLARLPLFSPAIRA